MVQGIELPVRAVNGRMALLSGDDYIEQLVLTALGDGESENPFQEIGLSGERFVFGINDKQTDGEIRQAIVDVFALLERDQLAKLDNPTTSVVFQTADTEATEKKVLIEYINMETQERQEFDVPLPAAA